MPARPDRQSPDESSAAAALRRLIVGYRLSQALSVAARLGIAQSRLRPP